MGMIIVAVVAVVATVVTQQYQLLPTIITNMGPAAVAAGAAAVGNVAGQVAGNLLGVQSGFDFKSLGTAMLTAGATEGLLGGTVKIGGQWSPVTEFGQAVGNAVGGGWAGVAARAAVGNVVNQGVGSLTGSQKGFSWSSVAVSAISAPVSQSLTNQMNLGPVGSSLGSDLARGATGALVAATTQVAIQGGKLNWQAIAANTLTSLIESQASRNDAVVNQQRVELGNTTPANSNASPGIDLTDISGPGFSLADEEKLRVSSKWDRDIADAAAALPSATKESIPQNGGRVVDWSTSQSEGVRWTSEQLQPVVVGSRIEGREVLVKEKAASNLQPKVEVDNSSSTLSKSDFKTPVMNGAISLLDTKSPYYELNKEQYGANNSIKDKSTFTSGANWYQLGKASLGLIGNGATIATGYTLNAVGYTAIVTPDPTTLTKWAGFAAAMVGTSLTGKGLAGFSLNAINFKRSLDVVKNDSDYLVGSALEWVAELRYGKGSPEVKLAQAADMSIDLFTNRALGSLKLSANINREVPILLQSTSASLKTKALYQSPVIYKSAETIGGYSGALSSAFTIDEVGRIEFKWWN